MSPSKHKLAAVGLFLAIVVSIGGGVMIYRAMAGKPFTVPQPLPYSPATPVAADVPIPDDFSMFFPLQTVVVLPKYSPLEPERHAAACATSRSLPEGVVVVTDPPDNYPAATALFRKALAQAGKGELRVEPGCSLSVLAVGPLLIPFAHVELRHLTCHGKRIEMEIAYTAKPPEKERKDEEQHWRPLVVVPLLLRAGPYYLEATWRAVDKWRDGKPLPVEPLVQTCSFVAPEGMAESPALRVHGVDFQALVDGRCPVPEAGHRRSLHFGLRVTNRGDKELLFEPSGVALFADSLRIGDGSLLRYRGGSDHTIFAKPVRVPAGRSHVFVVRGELRWFKDSGLQDVGWYKGGTGLALSGVVGTGDRFWYYDGLAVGKYRPCLDYQVLDRPESFWTGRVRTQDVEFEIVP